ncbi:hypothetical protein [Gynuella sunshinyii]|uniref:DUF2802 domain-containing protein n=1 Tax=Gynuella sunshinyii YC6258 TaxID=1445510 RepID=A0A0C5VKF2_9GAMM|nr:hypothetical protein [Gynuella sunshinyii]AJQ95167.1 hypothetical Protein YC6258_03131 [Gynuella sunshinyii YC6258]
MADFSLLFFSITASQLLIVAAVILQVLMLGIFWVSFRKLKKSYQTQIEDLQSYVNAVNQGAIGIGKRLIRVEKQLTQQNTRISAYANSVKPVSTPSSSKPLEEENVVVSIMKKTGLGRAEAQLLSRIQSGQKATAI